MKLETTVWLNLCKSITINGKKQLNQKSNSQGVENIIFKQQGQLDFQGLRSEIK